MYNSVKPVSKRPFQSSNSIITGCWPLLQSSDWPGCWSNCWFVGLALTTKTSAICECVDLEFRFQQTRWQMYEEAGEWHDLFMQAKHTSFEYVMVHLIPGCVHLVRVLCVETTSTEPCPLCSILLPKLEECPLSVNTRSAVELFTNSDCSGNHSALSSMSGVVSTLTLHYLTWRAYIVKLCPRVVINFFIVYVCSRVSCDGPGLQWFPI